ncbi:MAG: EI24 domain-containing protein [Bacteroidota bacterium]
MRFFRDIGTGIVAYYRSFEFIFRHHLWFYFLFPAAFSLVLLWLGGEAEWELREISFKDLPEKDYEFEMLITGLKAVFVFVALKMNRYLVLIILTPFLTLLSAQSDKIITGYSSRFSLKQYIIDINRSIQISVRNIVMQMFILAVWFFFALLIPILRDYTFYFMFVLGFYFYGFSLIDYTNERRKLTVEESYRYIRRHSGLAVIIGAIFSSLFFIPYAGVILAPVTGVVAATIGVSLIDKREEEPEKPPRLPHVDAA